MFVCFIPSAITQLLLLRSNISRGNIGNQHDITSFVIMRNIFSLRLNGRKSIYFCGESSYVSVLLAILPVFVGFTTSAIIQFLLLRANVSSLLPKYKQESRPRTI